MLETNTMAQQISDRLRSILSLRSLEATKMRELALKMKDVVRLTSGEPDSVTPQHIRDAAKRALDEGHTFYTPTGGIPEFREAVADKVEKEHKLNIDPASEVIATPGAIEGIFLTMMCTINPNDEVLIPDPCYVGYPTCTSFAGGVQVPVPLDEEEGFRLKPSEIEKRITPNSKMIVLNSPSNPCGAVISRDDLKEIAEIAIKHNLLVLSDEAYEKFVYDDVRYCSIFSFPEMKKRTILIGSLSKTYAMTGWRIGYLVAEKDLVQNFMKIQSSLVLCTNVIAQKAAVAALTGPQDCVEDMIREFDRRRRFIVKRLNSINGFKCAMPQGAFFVLPNTRQIEPNSLKLTEFLTKKAKVAVYPGIAFGNQGEGHIRITYSASIEQIETGLNRIEEALEKQA
jgi:aspartate/methionine/tyrosine aminotransferase